MDHRDMPAMNPATAHAAVVQADAAGLTGGMSAREMWQVFVAHWRLIVLSTLGAAVAAYGIAFVWPPTYTARTSFLPPQQQQSSGAMAALSSLGALAGLAGGAAALKTPADQYIALMQSVRVANRLIDRFQLIQVYDADYREEAQEELAKRSRFAAGRKDGLVTIEVDDRNAQRSADLANAYIDELRGLTNTMAISEAQQRRVFFEQQMQATQAKLAQAQVALQASGFNPGAIKAEPKAAAESYARLKAESTSAEVRLQTMRGMLADTSTEVVQQEKILAELRRQLARQESGSPAGNDADYIGRYREYKYQETLLELMARQYELARVDESREGALIQVLDTATAPERRSKPKRLMVALAAATSAFLLICMVVLVRAGRSA